MPNTSLGRILNISIFETNEHNETTGVVYNVCSEGCAAAIRTALSADSQSFTSSFCAHFEDDEPCASCGSELHLPDALSCVELDNLITGKFEYFTQCDKWRIRYVEGESLWHKMMRNKRPITVEAIKSKAELQDLLDDDETIEEFIADDPDAGFYLSHLGSEYVLFIQTAGFEFIFTRNGHAPCGDKLIKQ